MTYLEFRTALMLLVLAISPIFIADSASHVNWYEPAKLVSLKPGESLRLELSTSAAVLLYFKGSDSKDDLICTMEEDEFVCLSEYNTRVSVSNNTLVLNGVRPSDSGVYTVRDEKSDNIIVIYRVSVYRAQVSLKPGESLRLDLLTSDPVDVYFKRNDAESMNIASMEKNTALFHSEYKIRVSVSDKTLVLNGVIPSDSGVYSVREKKTNEIISVCNVTVSVHHSSLQLKTNESVRLNLFTSVPVEVILTWTNSYDSEDVVICTVENHKPDCLPQYKTRVSVSDNTLVLNGVRPSDSGIYTVREKETNEIINVYNISVSGNDSGDSWLTLLIVLIPVSVMVVVLLLVVFICLMRKCRHCKREGDKRRPKRGVL